MTTECLMCASRAYSRFQLQEKECDHIENSMKLGSELRKNYVFILYQLKSKGDSFLHVAYGLTVECIGTRCQ